uniref:18 kDa Sin3-associated polypeptide n=1 Tax=Parastrongyloides trichosuri TaxID=131310 RepID=A0A0N4Z207_PARTI
MDNIENNGDKVSLVKTLSECPFLIKIFIVKNQPHPFRLWRSGEYPKDILYYQTWMSCTLLDLTKYVNDELPEHFKHPTNLEFRVIQFDIAENGCLVRNIGTTRSDISTFDENTTLEKVKFEPGNFLEIVIKSVEPIRSMESKSFSDSSPKNYDNLRKRGFYDRNEGYGGKRNKFGDERSFSNRRDSFSASKGRRYH